MIKILPISQDEMAVTGTNFEEFCHSMIIILEDNANLYNRFIEAGKKQIPDVNCRCYRFLKLCVSLKIVVPGSKRKSYMVLASNVPRLADTIPANVPDLTHTTKNRLVA